MNEKTDIRKEMRNAGDGVSEAVIRSTDSTARSLVFSAFLSQITLPIGICLFYNEPFCT